MSAIGAVSGNVGVTAPQPPPPPVKHKDHDGDFDNNRPDAAAANPPSGSNRAVDIKA